MRYRILVVDDEPDVVNVMMEMLKTLDYDADGLTDSVKAIELIKTNNYDLIIADLIMPMKTGLDILEQAKNAGRRIPVIVSAGVDLDGTDIGLPEYDLVEFIQKPFTLKDIEQLLGKYFQSSKDKKVIVP